MTAYTSAGISGYWDASGAWVPTGYPGLGTGDTATLASGAYSITLGNGSTVYQVTIASLTFDGASTSAEPIVAINGATSAAELFDTGNLNVGVSGNVGEVSLSNGGVFEVDGGVGAAGVTINFADGLGDILALNGPGSTLSPPTAINSFLSSITGITVGDGIVLLNSATYAATTPLSDFTLTQHSTGYTANESGSGSLPAAIFITHLKLPTLSSGQYYTLAFDNYLGLGTEYLEIIVACLHAGTRVLTERGEVAVEDLREGDGIVTFSGRGDVVKPVTWIGQSRVALAGHPDPEAAWPVRIRAGAIAEQTPHRDLLVSPDHAIYLDGVLIPAKHLINGTTIVQDRSFDEVHYFHVELAEHDVLLAEGLPAETYLDTGNRDAFEGLRATLPGSAEHYAAV